MVEPRLDDLEALLRDGPPGVDPQHTARVVALAGERSAAEGVADVAYAFVDSPVGPLLTAATPRGLALISYSAEDPDPVLERLARRLSPRLVEAPGRFDDLRRELDQYFDGDRQGFDLPVDLRLCSPFERRVLAACARIPFGEVATYRDMAERAGSPRASRAAGNALGANPIPIVVPCHRVVRTGGALGGYGGGIPRKRFLLALEGR